MRRETITSWKNEKMCVEKRTTRKHRSHYLLSKSKWMFVNSRIQVRMQIQTITVYCHSSSPLMFILTTILKIIKATLTLNRSCAIFFLFFFLAHTLTKSIGITSFAIDFFSCLPVAIKILPTNLV